MPKLKRHLHKLARVLKKHLIEEHVFSPRGLATLRGYSLFKAKSDLRASLEVALVSLPQGMAFASLADLPLIYGVLSAAITTLVTPLFSESRLTISGPSNATAFMLASFFLANPSISESQKLAMLPVIVFGVGVVCLLGGFFKFADLLQYISKSVLTGYITGAALLIISSQLKYVLGIEASIASYLQSAGEGGKNMLAQLQAVLVNATSLNWVDVVLATLSLLAFIHIKRSRGRWPAFTLVLCGMSLLVVLLELTPLRTIFYGIARLGCVSAQSISFEYPHIFSANSFNMLFDTAAVIFAIAFVATLEQNLMSKTLGSYTGRKVNVNKDIYAIGIANMVAAALPSIPGSASLNRTMLNYTAGAKTRFSGVFSGVLCVLGCLVLLYYPLTAAIPKSVLGALIIANAMSLFDRRAIKICWNTTKSDSTVFVVTLLASLLAPLYVAIFVGAAFAIGFFLRKASKPELLEYTFNDEGELTRLQDNKRLVPTISIVHVEGDLFFGATELFSSQIRSLVNSPDIKVVILRLRNARNLDATAVWALDELISFSRRHQRHLIISGASRDVYRVLRDSGVLANLHADCEPKQRNIFLRHPQNPNMSTRRALQRAQALLGTREADIRIFVNPHGNEVTGVE